MLCDRAIERLDQEDSPACPPIALAAGVSGQEALSSGASSQRAGFESSVHAAKRAITTVMVPASCLPRLTPQSNAVARVLRTANPSPYIAYLDLP